MLDTQLLVRRDDVDDDVVTLEIDRQVARAVFIYLYQVGDHFAAGPSLESLNDLTNPQVELAESYAPVEYRPRRLGSDHVAREEGATTS
jgi:hypothetical protein